MSASELRPADAAGRGWPAELVALVGAVVDVVEDDLETELAEARREADELRARVVAVIERDRGFIGTPAMVPVDSIMAAIDAIGGAP